MLSSYSESIRSGFDYLLKHYDNVFVIGQGVWSPWYVGTSMINLDVVYGKDRIIDTPVSELGVTGMCVGAALNVMRTICVHPRMDFAILAFDQLVNQAAKWSHMFGGQSHVPLTARLIINRGGEQGTQHSQALHAWLMHIPGLRVVMPYSVQDARDLLVAAILCDDPVAYIDDRWLYETTSSVTKVRELSLNNMAPKCIREGQHITLVGAGYSTHLCMQAAEQLTLQGIRCEVIDLRVLNPLKIEVVRHSVEKTGRLLVVDGGWTSCGLAAEVIAKTLEAMDLKLLKKNPQRITLVDAPAPTSRALEKIYYPTVEQVCQKVKAML
ncbi:MAG: hypothetical protein LBD69_04000 [Puniceicoccales bacterium]|jgi:pyruvate dehydrogenase E1 component beta subunit|nr:hypothetical protein [Puniceicoccales bacterium]